MYSLFFHSKHWRSSSSYLVSPGSSRLLEGLITSLEIIYMPVKTGYFCSVLNNLCIIILFLSKTPTAAFMLHLGWELKINTFLFIFFLYSHSSEVAIEQIMCLTLGEWWEPQGTMLLCSLPFFGTLQVMDRGLWGDEKIPFKLLLKLTDQTLSSVRSCNSFSCTLPAVGMKLGKENKSATQFN